MLNDLFISLSKALESGPVLAIIASFVWGLFSVLLSPCHLASIPLVVGFVSSQEDKSSKKAFLLSLLFASGVILTILLVGVVTGLLGRMLGDIGLMGKIGNIIVAIVLLIVAAYLMGFISLSFLQVGGAKTSHRKGYWALFLAGLIFGLSVGPCTFAYMAPILAFTFSSAAKNIGFAIILFTAFAVGHALVIILAGTFSAVLERYLQWNKKSKGLAVIKKICAILLLGAAIYILFQ